MGCLKLPEAPTIWLPEHEPTRGGFARGLGGRMSGRRLISVAPAGSAPFNGNFATLFTTPYQSVQTDLGLTYGGTMLASGTTPPVVTLTGALVGPPVPIRMTVGVTGALGVWTWQISYDGGGSIDEVGASAAGPTALRAGGPGNGLSISIAAGNAAADNVWLATCAGFADQSGNGKNYSQATATKQPVITVGVNGFPGLLFNGVSNNLVSLLNLPAPGTTPYSVFAVFRQTAWVANTVMFGPTGQTIQSSIFQAVATPTIFNRVNSTGPSNGTGAPINTWVEMEIYRSLTASDPFKLGTVTVTGATGNIGLTGMEIGSCAGATFGALELLALAFAPGAQNWTAVRAAVTAKYGAGVSI